MNALQHFLAMLGRMCLSLIFILAGINKILDWQGMEQVLHGALCDTLVYVQGIDWAVKGIESALPMTPALLIIGTIAEILGGILVFLGLKARLGAFILILFVVPSTLIFHHFWFLQEPDRHFQMAMFMKNLSILGGLLVILAVGTGGGKKIEKPSKAKE